MREFIKVLCLAIMAITLYPATSMGTEKETLSKYLYIEAVRQQDMGHYALAMELFSRCLELTPDAAEVNYALGLFHHALGKDSIGKNFVARAVELEPKNTEFGEQLAYYHLRQNNIEEAAEAFERLAKMLPQRLDYLEMLAKIYENQHEYDKLLDVLGRVELQEGQSESLTLSKMRAFSLMGNQEGAYKELRSLVDSHPNDMNLQVMLGNWLMNNERKAEALGIFQKVMKEEPDNAQAQMSLMDYYRIEGDKEQADRLLYEMLINPKTEPATRISMVRDWVRDTEEAGGDSARVMQMFDKVLSLPQKTSEVAEMRTSYLTLKNAPHDSIRAGWEKVLEITPEHVEARMLLIQTLWEDSVDENVIRECKKAVEYVPNEPSLYYYLGLAQYLNDHHDDAIASLRRGAANITKETNATLAGDIYHMLGDAYHKIGKKEEAFVAYDSCLVYTPDNVLCLNNYSYFLSLENRDLKKAEKMSYRAITAQPNNATYLDTYAWILYQQNRFEEARIYIDMALKNDTDSVNMSGDILEHAGDIYMRLGQATKAYEFWEKALPLGVEDEATLRRKIKKKL